MIVEVRVKPGSKKGPLVQPSLDGALLVYVREPAVEGKANLAVLDQLSDFFSVSKNKIQIISGQTSRYKRYKIDIPD